MDTGKDRGDRMNSISSAPTYIMDVVRHVPVFVWYAAVSYYFFKVLRWAYRKVAR